MVFKEAYGQIGRVTVLDAYERWESEAVWRETSDAQRRDVVVSIGDATLTITDLHDVALTHWSLAALERRNPGERPAIFAPSGDAPETLEIADDTMVAALTKIMKSIRRRGKRPGSIRILTFLLVIAAITAFATLWLPGAMARYAATLVPDSYRQALGESLVDHITTLTGAPCSSDAGSIALSRVSQIVLPDQQTQFVVLSSALESTASLPDGTILLSHKLAEDYESPHVLAAAAIAESLRFAQEDPVEHLLRGTGARASFRFLTTGEIASEDLREYARQLIAIPRAAADPATLDARLNELSIVNGDVAQAFNVQPKNEPRALLDDGDWIALQTICTP